MIHFELILVCSVMFRSRLMSLFSTNVQLFQHNLLKKMSFLHGIAFAHLSKIDWPFQQIMLWNLDIQTQKNEFGLIPHTIYKKLTQIYQRPKCKSSLLFRLYRFIFEFTDSFLHPHQSIIESF